MTHITRMCAGVLAAILPMVLAGCIDDGNPNTVRAARGRQQNATAPTPRTILITTTPFVVSVLVAPATMEGPLATFTPCAGVQR